MHILALRSFSGEYSKGLNSEFIQLSLCFQEKADLAATGTANPRESPRLALIRAPTRSLMPWSSRHGSSSFREKPEQLHGISSHAAGFVVGKSDE